MIPNCQGCIYEFQEALWQQKQGYYVATMKNDTSERIGKKGHYGCIIVNSKGKLIMW